MSNGKRMRMSDIARSGLLVVLLNWVYLASLSASDTTLQRLDNELRAVWQTEPGFSYRIERSLAMRAGSWLPLNEIYYGTGGVVSSAILRTFDPPQSFPEPPQGGDTPSESWLVFVDAFSDGTLRVTTLGSDYHTAVIEPAELPAGSPANGLYFEEGGNAVSKQGHIAIDDGFTDYYISIFVNSFDGVPGTDFDALLISPELSDDSSVSFITQNLQEIRTHLLNANPPAFNPPDPPPNFDDLGRPLRSFYRVQKLVTDSNFDGVPDHVDIANGQTDGFALEFAFRLNGIVHNVSPHKRLSTSRPKHGPAASWCPSRE